MAVARINIKNIDYFKFRKLIIDGSRDDYAACSKEVKAFCDCVQTFNFRDEEFEDLGDRRRFEEVCMYYKQILQGKRIDSLDMRIKSGWWGDHKNSYSAGKLKPGVLRDVLVQKAQQWAHRHGQPQPPRIAERLDGPGLFVLKHKDRQCFQYVGRADKLFPRFAEKLKSAFDGSLQEPLAALLIMSMANDWEFYFMSVDTTDDERLLRILENDLILKHDSIWPHGLNFCLHIDSLLEVSQFRRSCLRYNWPPCEIEASPDIGEGINIDHIREQLVIHAGADETIFDPAVAATAEIKPGGGGGGTHKSPKKKLPAGAAASTGPPAAQQQQQQQARPEWRSVLDGSDTESNDLLEDGEGGGGGGRPSSPMSDVSGATYIVEHVDGSSVQLEYQSIDEAGNVKPLAFMVPMNANASPRKIRPGTVTLASRRERTAKQGQGQEQSGGEKQEAEGENKKVALADNKRQPPSTLPLARTTTDKSPQTARKAGPAKDGGKENTAATDVSARGQKGEDADAVGGVVGKPAGAANTSRSPRTKLQRPTSAGKTRPRAVKR